MNAETGVPPSQARKTDGSEGRTLGRSGSATDRLEGKSSMWFARLALLFGIVRVIGLMHAAELEIDFSKDRPGERPSGWSAFTAGSGRLSDWKVLLDDAPSALPQFAPDATRKPKRPVLAQLLEDPTDEHFPVALFEGQRFGDFRYSAQIKVVKGGREQIAGLAFRVQDQKNFYVARVSVLGKNLRFYKFVDGQRSDPLGPEIEVKAGEWNQLEVECTGNRIRIRWNGKDAMPELTDNSLSSGRLGMITKSDTVAYFADVRVVYQPLETLAQQLVKYAIEKYPRLLGVRVYGKSKERSQLHILSSSNVSELQAAAGEVEEKVFEHREPYIGKVGDRIMITYPLYDRNGDALGVVKFALQSFKGQTEANALARVRPIVDDLQKRIGASLSLTD